MYLALGSSYEPKIHLEQTPFTKFLKLEVFGKF